MAKKMVQAIEKSKDAGFELNIKEYAKKAFSPDGTGDCLKNRLLTLNEGI